MTKGFTANLLHLFLLLGCGERTGMQGITENQKCQWYQVIKKPKLFFKLFNLNKRESQQVSMVMIMARKMKTFSVHSHNAKQPHFYVCYVIRL